MFEVAELGHQISKKDYQLQVPLLRTQLLMVQQQLRTCRFPVIILISGVDGGGKGEVINFLNEWMDPRFIRTIAFDRLSDEEIERPKFWRYWRALPEKGAIGIFVGSWYSDHISRRTYRKIDKHDFAIELGHIKLLEQELIDDGALIIKCWLHLRKGDQKKRLKKLEQNPDTAWKVTSKDKRHLKKYDKFMAVAEHALKATSTGRSPWLIIEGSDIRYSSLSVGKHVLERINQHIKFSAESENKNVRKEIEKTVDIVQQSLLDTLDLNKQINKKIYNKKLLQLQAKLGLLTRATRQRKISSILVFEGWDAAGKGGAIRRLTRGLDARNYQVISIAAPTDEERNHHYLWRFWRHIPRSGNVTIYDRSWYGRVLVERVEGFASKDEWMRAYTEIFNFEDQLTREGHLLLKFWLHIDAEEQLKRFQEREKISYKQYKITDEDYRNRERWDEYKLAVNDMVARTSTESTPWVLVEAKDKKFARIKILETYCRHLEEMLD
jgi:polyphosphate:AMP phosphotransferase